MSADERLREAVKVLRERAEAATRGYWVVFPKGQVVADSGWAEYISVSKDSTDATADYVATMQPDLGLALADWLDWGEDEVDRYPDWRISPHVLRMVDLILGDQP